LLPRQLGSASNYRRFAPGLRWHGWQPSFIPTRYDVRRGVDRGPVQDQEWIRQCYGPSAYYDERYAELVWAFEQPDVRAAAFAFTGLDLLETDKLSRFLVENAVNVVTCSYVLYQYAEADRRAVVAAVVDALPPAGLFLSFEPTGDLLTPGAAIRIHLPGDPRPLEFGYASDGHCLGTVTPGPDFGAFRKDFL
jgi:hypothetical protein